MPAIEDPRHGGIDFGTQRRQLGAHIEERHVHDGAT
jgi:hypothetical protein